MNDRALVLVLALVGAPGLAACGDDIPTTDADGTSSGGPATQGDATAPPTATSAPPSDDTAGTTVGPEPEVLFELNLALETTEVATIVWAQAGDALQATVTPSEGFGVAAPGEALTGPARIDAFPEADATFYTARLEAPAQPGGPCGDQPVSLALSLHHDGDATFVAGALTPYCGAATFFGVPPIEPLRLSGDGAALSTPDGP